MVDVRLSTEICDRPRSHRGAALSGFPLQHGKFWRGFFVAEFGHVPEPIDGLAHRNAQSIVATLRPAASSNTFLAYRHSHRGALLMRLVTAPPS